MTLLCVRHCKLFTAKQSKNLQKKNKHHAFDFVSQLNIPQTGLLEAI
jgi:hypothetical protein